VNALRCCEAKGRAEDNVLRPASWMRRGAKITGWIVPATTLALLPKCPACVAAYVALGTGIGISLPAATFLRGILLALCLMSLAFIIARQLRSLMMRALSRR